jgi:hypothetical protein
MIHYGHPVRRSLPITFLSEYGHRVQARITTTYYPLHQDVRFPGLEPNEEIPCGTAECRTKDGRPIEKAGDNQFVATSWNGKREYLTLLS